MKSIAAAVLCASCATIKGTPVLIETFHQPYDKLASCFYMRVREETGTGIKYEEMRANRVVLVSAHGGEVAIWESWFIGIDANSSKVEIKAMPTIWGNDFHAQQLIPHVRSCA